jgi:6-phosphofructokinase
MTTPHSGPATSEPEPLCSPPGPETDLRRVAILFSGGPAPAANAVIASAATCFSRAGIEVLGIRNGYKQLVQCESGAKPKEGADYVVLRHQDLEGKRTSQGIMLGTSRENPGKTIKAEQDLENPKCNAKLKTVYDALCSLGVDALISIGGDDTLTTAAKFKLFQDKLPPDRKRIRVVHLPKTIDNDYEGIDFTFGYFTAVDMLATEMRNLLADAESTGVYFIAQVMGRKAGWLAYGAAIAGEASLVIGVEDISEDWKSKEPTIDPQTGQEVKVDPETNERVKPGEEGVTLMREVFDVSRLVGRIVDTMEAREKEGRPYGVVVMAEGIAEYVPQAQMREFVSERQYRALKPDSFGHFPVSQVKFSSWIGQLVAEEYIGRAEQRGEKKEKRVNGVQFGYEVRSHRPTAFDVALGSQLGVGAYRGLAEEGEDGVMVSIEGQLKRVYKPFFNEEEPDKSLVDRKTLTAKVRLIDPKEDFHQLARYLETRVDDQP